MFKDIPWIITRFLLGLIHLNTPQMVDNTTMISVTKSSSSRTRSVQLDGTVLEKFDGNVRKYLKFKDEFDRYIEPMYTEAQLALILWSHLSNEVQDEIEYVDASLSSLWSALDSKYGRKGKQIDAILSDVIKVMHRSTQNMQQMINTLERAYRDLARIGCQSEMHTVFFISFIERKLPKNIRLDWTKHVVESYDDDGEKKFKLMLAFLRKQKAALE